MRRKMKNTAAPAIHAPAPRQTIHQHGTNWPLVIIAGVAAGALAMWVSWLFLAFLFWMMGSREPGALAAEVVFGILVLAVLALVSREIVGYFISKWFDGKRELQELINDGLYHQQIAAQSGVTDSRTTSEDSRLVKIIMLVMSEAYRYYGKYGAYGTNDARPWSRRSVAGLTIAGESKPVGETVINSKLRWWLEREEIIIDKQINVDQFPELENVRELVQRRFNVPVKFVGNIAVNTSLPNQGYGFGDEIQK